MRPTIAAAPTAIPAIAPAPRLEDSESEPAPVDVNPFLPPVVPVPEVGLQLGDVHSESSDDALAGGIATMFF